MIIKPLQLRLKVAWFKNFLGLAVDQEYKSTVFFNPILFLAKNPSLGTIKIRIRF
jgi:hypothetical protein